MGEAGGSHRPAAVASGPCHPCSRRSRIRAAEPVGVRCNDGFARMAGGQAKRTVKSLESLEWESGVDGLGGLLAHRRGRGSERSRATLEPRIFRLPACLFGEDGEV